MYALRVPLQRARESRALGGGTASIERGGNGTGDDDNAANVDDSSVHSKNTENSLNLLGTHKTCPFYIFGALCVRLRYSLTFSVCPLRRREKRKTKQPQQLYFQRTVCTRFSTLASVAHTRIKRGHCVYSACIPPRPGENQKRNSLYNK